MARISKIDLNQLNEQFLKFEELKNQLAELRQQHSITAQRVGTLESHAAPTSNNLNFHWTGGSLTLNWNDGSVRDKTGANVPVKAGTLTVLASHYYWLAWNKEHRQMVADTDAGKLLTNKNNILICQVFTGTAGQTGSAGGGGSNSATELSGAKYKNF